MSKSDKEVLYRVWLPVEQLMFDKMSQETAMGLHTIAILLRPTGWHDRVGTEVYEGDWIYVPMLHNKIWEVIHLNDKFYVKDLDGNVILLGHVFDYEYKVIQSKYGKPSKVDF